ncbi:unnamed protein product [Oppiella nova]|uniref:Uncharacterized protein n=1 Tax=Oppiella nova TaxID=334625 RepID=A0A7R9QNU5_9ACAR|nr:unnamed protein product [Oppiella nova]CAG2169514.1 unnamed protein product [Oppiella nova]
MDQTMDQLNDEALRREAIQFFKSLINFKTNQGKSTRPHNFAGHIGRHMSPEMKKWFLVKYPNQSDFVKFFLEFDRDFVYDHMSGEVGLKRADTRFVRPLRLKQLEDQCVDWPSMTPDSMAAIVCEVELFLHVFRELVDGYEFAKTTEVSINRLVDVLDNKRYDYLVSSVGHIVADPKTDKAKFSTDLMDYLKDNYVNTVVVNVKRRCIQLPKSVVEILKQVRDVLDDTVYAVLKYLVAIHLMTNGPQDVDHLKNEIGRRHETIVGHVFGVKPNDDFTLLDFVECYPDLFGYQRIRTADGHTLRLINVKMESIKTKAKTVAPIETSVPVVTIGGGDDREFDDSNEEIYLSDDEIYIEDED